MPTITVYSDTTYTTDSPIHVWIDLTDDNGEVSTYSYGPAESGQAFGDGFVYPDEDNTRADISSTWDITQEQYDQMKAEGERLRLNPPDYDVTGFYNENCVTIADQIMEAGGMNLGTGAFSPYAVKNSLALRNTFIELETFFSASQIFRPPVDPLAFDLDGDGIETLAENGNNGVLFDHEGNGVKTATGWIAPDDGFLVYDRNGNGVIDNGTELFGDNTALNAGGLAANGFEALADFDTNADGVVDANDANFADLRIWQDINSDGISQASELLTLEQAGVASINTAYEDSSIAQNGNVISGLGSYTRTDGTSSSMGSATSLVNLDLANSSFYSAFVDSIPVTAEAALLPTMNGSGRVRNMQEAA